MPSLDTPLEHSPEGCCWLATHQTIDELTLPDIAAVVRRKAFWDDTLATPNIVVCPASEAISANEGTNESDDIQYAFMVSVVAANNRDLTDATAGWLLFCSYEIRKAFHNRNVIAGPELPTGTFITRIVVEPGAKYIDAALRKNYDAAYQLIRFTVREQRD